MGRSPVPFGVELLQLMPAAGRHGLPGGPVTSAFRRGASSADENSGSYSYHCNQVTSAFRRGASSAEHGGRGTSVSVGFVTSAFRRGASSAAPAPTLPRLPRSGHQCLSAWSFFSCPRTYVGSKPTLKVTSAFRRGASSADNTKAVGSRWKVVTSAFRRGASSAEASPFEATWHGLQSPVPFGVELLQLR